MRGELSGRWSALADLVLAAACGTILWLWPQSVPWPLAPWLIPWLSRISRRQYPFQRTPLDLPIAVFLITAAVAAWVSYDWQTSLAKLWLLVAATIFFYALARQPRANDRLVMAFLSGVGAAIAIYFLLTNDWRVLPADLGFINSLGFTWMAIRPSAASIASIASLSLMPPPPNIAGGLIALFAPFNLALLAEARKTRDRMLAGYALVTGGLSALGLLMTSSRAAWLALGLGLGIWSLWLLSGWFSKRFAASSAPRTIVFAAGLGFMAASAIVLVFLAPGGMLGLFNRLPGSNSAPSRLEIYAGTLRLVQDFPYTGGGLHAFPGLFSHYILGIPVPMFNYAHSAYLDLAVEQGLLGLAAFLCILAGGVWLLLKGEAPSELRWAIFTSTLVMLLHGLVDDPLFASRGTPFLFFLPALSVAISSRHEANHERLPERSGKNRRLAAIAMLAVLLVTSAASLASMNWKRLLASGYANLGAVRMAQVELADFSRGMVQDGSQVPALAGSEALLKRAIEIDPENVTASYRLGLIAMLRRDYPTAQFYLERVHAQDPGHQGVRKSLGYCYAWQGDFERAGKLLADLPGVRHELEIYIMLWRERGRPDLVEKANEMIKQLGG